MQRHKLVLAVVLPLVLAGCLGGLAAEPSDSTTVSPEQVPGVTNGTLTNASALLEADRTAVTTDGAVLEVNRSSEGAAFDARAVIGANYSTYSLSASGAFAGEQSRTVEQWTNETTLVVRTTEAGETTYRVLDRPGHRPDVRGAFSEFVSAGAFEVDEEATGEGRVVLTANRSAASAPIDRAGSFEARLVVNESGQIRALSVNVTVDGESASYSYRLRRTGVTTAPKPDWVDAVPESASVQAELSVDVVNDSYLALEHTGGDAVPSGTTVRLESNGTVDTVRLEASLSSEATRYLYFDSDSGSLRVTTDRPERRTVSPVTSPASVRVTTEEGVVLHSGSFAWASEGVSEGSDGSSGADGSEGSE